MKIVSVIFLALALAAIPSIGQEKLSLDEADSVRTYTPAQFMKEIAANPKDGTLIRIKFNGRTASLSQGPDGSKIGYVQSRDMTNYSELSSQMEVRIPPAGLPWFQHVNLFSYASYERLSVKSYIVYGRVKVDPTGKAGVSLVGLEVKHDLDGDTIVWDQSSNTP